MPSIIQFLHTAQEAQPKVLSSNKIDWNNHKSHRRKFLLSNGRYISNNTEQEEKLTFWGEWEAQSYITKLKKTLPFHPNYINRPFINFKVKNRLHNTDPHIFGKHFKYLICRQKSYDILRNLEPFSMILFGSNINNKFCLDTLFLVSNESTPFTIKSIEETFNQKDQYYYLSVQQLLNEKTNSTNFRYYEGVQYRNKKMYHNIYSFVPSKLYNPNNDASYVFKQPIINLDIINHKLLQGINSNNNHNYTIKEIVHYWNEIVNQIERFGLFRGIYFENP
jgi:hypothetical protein